MTVDELIRELQAMPADAPVIYSTDAERLEVSLVGAHRAFVDSETGEWVTEDEWHRAEIDPRQFVTIVVLL